MKTFLELCLQHLFKSLLMASHSLAFQGGSVLRRWVAKPKMPLCLHTRKQTSYIGGRERGLFSYVVWDSDESVGLFPRKNYTYVKNYVPFEGVHGSPNLFTYLPLCPQGMKH